jgi:hypothetical protein
MEYQTIQNQTSTFHVFVELKPAPNNDIYEIKYLQQCKIKFEPPKHEIAHCAVKDMGTQKNYCHLKPRCVKCAGNHPTIQC